MGGMTVPRAADDLYCQYRAKPKRNGNEALALSRAKRACINERPACVNERGNTSCVARHGVGRLRPVHGGGLAFEARTSHRGERLRALDDAGTTSLKEPTPRRYADRS